MLQRLHVAHNSKVFIIWPFTEKNFFLPTSDPGEEFSRQREQIVNAKVS